MCKQTHTHTPTLKINLAWWSERRRFILISWYRESSPITTRLPPSLRHIWNTHIDIWIDNSTILLCAIWWVIVLWRCHWSHSECLLNDKGSWTQVQNPYFFWGDTSNISYNLHQPPVRGPRPISSWHGVSGRGTSRADTRKTDSTLSPPESHSTTKTNQNISE